MIRVLKWNRRNHIKVSIILAAALLLAAMHPYYILTAHADDVVLKVGYSDSDGVIVDEKGNYSGYAVDYLEEIAQYTGWEYEYICDTWKNSMDKLEAGELDLLVMTHYTEERGERFLFSDLSMAHDYTTLYAAAGSDIYYQDYEAFDGCRVGAAEGTIFGELFIQYAEEQGLDCEVAYFSTEEDAKESLFRGDIDLIATGGVSHLSEVKLVDRFRSDRAYLATGKQNQQLMDELNDAMQKVRIQNRDLETNLMKTYYNASSDVTNLYLTREEQEYIDSIGPIVIKGFDQRQPLGYTDENGDFIGILVDYMNTLGEMSGLEFVYEPTELMTLEENVSAMAKDEYCLLFTDQSLEKLGLEESLYKTDALFETSLAYIRRQGEYVTKDDSHTFAINREMRYVGDLLLETNSGSTVLYYNTSMKCMEAVLDGKADMTILDAHVAAYLLQKPEFADNLLQIQGSGAYAADMCLYAPKQYEPLISILNKTLEHLTEEQQRYTISTAALSHSYQYQLEDMLYESGVLIVSLAVIIVLSALLYVRFSRYKAQQKENEALQERIQRDELTGVYSRAFFFEKAREMIEKSEGELYIVRLNVCHFKVINELYGSAKGDRLLQEIGRRLKDLSLQKGFAVGRFTADHFYLCIRREDFEAIGFAKRSPAPQLGMDIMLTYGVYPVESQNDIPVNAMCDRANIAITSNEQASSDYIYYYSDESRQRLLYVQEIESEMEQALAERQFCIYIQPKYDIETETTIGGEALVRWKHPLKGMIPPGDFINLFEQNGFILNLDHYVWEESCRFLAESRAKGLPVYPLSINVSRIHFYSTNLKDTLMELLTRYKLEPTDLELEITEGVCSEDPEVIFSKCEELRALGFKIAMDDFGSGYSSLNMLKRMPLDIIKMDLRFLSEDADTAQAKKGRSILCSLIDLAHTLGLQVVVEGIETEAQTNFIRSMGKCSAQGYYYSRPVDCQSYEAMIG